MPVFVGVLLALHPLRKGWFYMDKVCLTLPLLLSR